LAVGDAEVSQGAGGVRVFDAFGDELAADGVGEVHQGGGQGCGGGEQFGDQDQVELDDLGPQGQEVAQAGVAGAGVVDGQAQALGA